MSQEDLRKTLEAIFLLREVKNTIVEIEEISASLCEDFCMLLDLLKDEIRKKVSA